MACQRTDSIYETSQNFSGEENKESTVYLKDRSNTDFEDEEGDLRLDSFEENSVVTLASSALPSQTIKVYLRLKPFPSEIDLSREQEDAYTIVNSTTLLTRFPGSDVNTRSLKNLKASERVSRTFTFTAAFGSNISQSELFNEAIVPQIQLFLDGQSSTVMSYGTSNAGKSYTLYGTVSALGIIPLSIHAIFRTVGSMLSTPWYKPTYRNQVIGLSSSDCNRELEIRDELLSSAVPEKAEFVGAYQTIQERMREEGRDLGSARDEDVIYSVWISFAEIYNDTIYDLLCSDCQKKRLPLKMVTDKQGRTFIKDLRTVYVNSDEEAYQILLAGQYKSRIAATTLNPRSSRSHCIFTVKLLKYYAESEPKDVEVSALSFCDLAGSGRLKITTNVGDRLKETQNINTSLLVFGRCLKSIWEGQSARQKSELVAPFRESKLTRLFQRALSGKEHLTLVVNVNPLPSLYAETQNVLNFSAIAKKIIVEPVKEIRRKIFMSRFSRVVAQSTRTVTDWDQAAVEHSTHEINPEKVKKSDYILREYYEDLSAEYEKLKKEYSALKASVLDKDLEIREEMANTYTRLINDIEANWRSRSNDVEKHQEQLFAWSMNQVENFYKEKLNRLKSRKRRRWDDGDAVVDKEADFREIEAENASLTAKILVTKETIKELRSARENAIADKNKAVFELSLVKEQIIGLKKMLEAAENDVRSKDDSAHLTEELKRQLSNREERIKNLKEFLEEAKEEYIRITSDAGQMHEELKVANATLIENAEKIEDLEQQLDQSSIFLAKRDEEIKKLTEKLQCQSRQSAEFAERARFAEEELMKSESVSSRLNSALEDSKKLHKNVFVSAPDLSIHNEHSFTDSKSIIESERNTTESKETEMSNVDSEDSDYIETDETIDTKNRRTYNSKDSRELNTSGIAMTMSNDEQTIEQITSTVDTDLETNEENNQMSSSASCDKNFKQNSTLQSPDAVKFERESQFAKIIARVEIKINEYKSKINTFRESPTKKMDGDRIYCNCLNDKVLVSEIQLLEAHSNLKTIVLKRFDEHGVQIKKLEKELFELKDDLLSQFMENKAYITLSREKELLLEVEELKIALAKFRILEANQRKHLLSSDSMIQVEDKSLVSVEELSRQEREKDFASHSEPPEVITVLQVQEIVLIIFLVIVYLVELVRQ